MALPAVGSSAYPTRAELRDAMLRTVKLAFQRRGLSANVLPGSDHYIRCDAVAKRLAIAYANLENVLDTLSPLDAQEEYLEALCGVFGITRRGASRAAGYVTIVVTGGGTITIPAGFQCTSAAGVKYQTTSANVAVSNGASVQVQAVNAGASTNVVAGALVSWDSASIGFLGSTATVAAGGIINGFDEDDDEKLRERLIDRLSYPQGGGNISQFRAWAEETSAAIEKAYAYAAARGPGSVDVALTSEGGTREVSSLYVAEVSAYIATQVPGHVGLNVTSVVAQELDVVLLAKLPLPPQAGGSGGGWRDATPWPSGAVTLGVSDGKVTGYVSGTGTATVRETTAPVVGQRIGVWDPTGGTDGDGTMREYEVATVGGVAGAWTITVANGFTVSPLGAYVSAGAANLADYGDTFLAAMQSLGPGEKTTSTNILPRGRRQPPPDVSNPSDATSKQLDAITSTFAEVLDLSYAARLETGTTTTRTAPSVPATTTLAPRILTLKHFAIRAST